MSPRAEKLFCTVDFSRIERNEEMMDTAVLRRRVEEEVQKVDKNFRVKAVNEAILEFLGRRHRESDVSRFCLQNQREGCAR